MSRTALLSLLMILTVAAGATTTAAPAQAASNQDNCIIDPFTDKLICPIWPTCTMDPFTGKTNCPPPKPKAAARVLRSSPAVQF